MMIAEAGFGSLPPTTMARLVAREPDVTGVVAARVQLRVP